MSTERKPQAPKDEARMEKQNMDQPQEEFVGDEAQPSRDISELRASERPAGAGPEKVAPAVPRGN